MEGIVMEGIYFQKNKIIKIIFTNGAWVWDTWKHFVLLYYTDNHPYCLYAYCIRDNILLGSYYRGITPESDGSPMPAE